jgi:hypothetical protein
MRRAALLRVAFASSLAVALLQHLEPLHRRIAAQCGKRPTPRWS